MSSPELFPAPGRAHFGPTQEIDGAVSIHASSPAVADVLGAALFRRRVPWQRGGDGWPVRFEETTEVVGTHGSYELVVEGEQMVVRSASTEGLVHGATTAGQLWDRDEGATTVGTGHVVDAPVVPLRMLAGWGLYRHHRLDEAIDLAVAAHANRLLFNWWTAMPGDRLGDREAALVDRARSVGVELVCEIRRQVLGPGFRVTDRAAVDRLLDLYDGAVDAGFRCFGLLFDDTDLDPVEDELALLGIVVEHLTARLGQEPEFWFCPRYYWFPGDLDYSWLPRTIGPDGPDQVDLTPILGDHERRTEEDAGRLQRHYQDRLADVLPDRTLVYLANWWGGTPADWRPALSAGWTDRLGRDPAFWDNQLQNDHRLGLVVPRPLRDRPAAFAAALPAYALNSGVPLAGCAPATLTALAWCWNPDAYEPAVAFRGALRVLVGAAADATEAALTAWAALVDDLTPDDAQSMAHVAGLRDAARAGEGHLVRSRLREVGTALRHARAELDPRAAPLAVDLFEEIERDLGRVELELELAELGTDGPLPPAGQEQVSALWSLLSVHLARRLPPASDIEDLLAARSLDLATPGPGLSWFLHFHASALQNGVAQLDGVSRAGRG